ncbi:cell division protein FtsQ [Lishizhenia tianjinensis]|uniref:Cell division protein FtsQ n=1 Tax=Lishizhenia tianjinensis TaxID=477690 RepID=A0A1I6ZZ17_9FLAO|nr:hypothetical protein [Lishizhenia tianjinensis]SFT67903.1 cell division protein FtsQ [Lishizhenia tianjinensis]
MKPWLRTTLWSIFAAAVLVLLVASQYSVSKKKTSTPKMHIHEHPGMSFLTEEELLTQLKRAGLWNENTTVDSLKIKNIEAYIQKLNVVDSVNVYTNLGGNWEIDVQIRRPIVRVLPEGNSGFYIDDKGEAMQLSDFPAHVLIATGLDELTMENASYKRLINNDSLITISKLDDLYRISKYVCNSTFFNALFTQLHYDNNKGFKLIPRVGNQEIVFGLAQSDEEVDKKFNKLKIFYDEIIPYEGWEKYESIDLRFEEQIVGKKK